jgi:hypothetical protein
VHSATSLVAGARQLVCRHAPSWWKAAPDTVSAIARLIHGWGDIGLAGVA